MTSFMCSYLYTSSKQFILCFSDELEICVILYCLFYSWEPVIIRRVCTKLTIIENE